MDENQPSKQSTPPLHYASPPQPPPRKFWASRLLPGGPLPLGMIYLIMFALSVLAVFLAAVIASIVHAFR